MLGNSGLWARLEAFTADDPQAEFQFTDRLARENGWTKAFAKGAFAEYKKFVYLAATGPHEVTPSNVVDQVWHLHLTFTRSYWEELCGRVLERPLHHGPTKGGRSERRRFREQYEATLALYRREFDCEPPPAYWPDADARFDGVTDQHWIDRRTHFVVAKPNVRAWLAALGLAAGTAAAIGAAHGASAAAESASSDTDNLIVIGVIVAVLLVLSLIPDKRKNKGGSSCGGGSGCSCSASGKGEGDGGDGGGGCGGGGCGGGCGGD